MPSKASRAAAKEILQFFIKPLPIKPSRKAQEQDIKKVAEIIEKHTGGPPDNGTKIPHYSKLKGILKRHKFCGISLATK